MSLNEKFKSSSGGFPQKAVEDCITKALEDQSSIQSILHGDPKAPTVSGSWEPEIDSLVVVEIICAIEEQLGMSLPQTFIPRGGYTTKKECMDDLVSKAKAVWVSSVIPETEHA